MASCIFVIRGQKRACSGNVVGAKLKNCLTRVLHRPLQRDPHRSSIHCYLTNVINTTNLVLKIVT